MFSIVFFVILFTGAGDSLNRALTVQRPPPPSSMSSLDPHCEAYVVGKRAVGHILDFFLVFFWFLIYSRDGFKIF